MQAILKQNTESQKEFIVILSSAFLLSMFLFFIDEGYYDFRWMKVAANWIVFFIYFSIISFGQIILLKLLTGVKFGKTKMISIVILVSMLALWVAFRFIFKA